MGHVVKKILGDHESNPDYEGLVVELNADGRIHVHSGPMRLDLSKDGYNTLFDAIMNSWKCLENRHGWKKTEDISR